MYLLVVKPIKPCPTWIFEVPVSIVKLHTYVSCTHLCRYFYDKMESESRIKYWKNRTQKNSWSDRKPQKCSLYRIIIQCPVHHLPCRYFFQVCLKQGMYVHTCAEGVIKYNRWSMRYIFLTTIYCSLAAGIMSELENENL